MADLTCDRCLGRPHFRKHCGAADCFCSICHPAKWKQSWKTAVEKTVYGPKVIAKAEERARALDVVLDVEPVEPAVYQPTAPKVKAPFTWTPSGGSTWTEDEWAQIETARAAGWSWADLQKITGRHCKESWHKWHRTGVLAPLRGAYRPRRSA